MTVPLIPLVVATALFMENMDSTILATALPAIAADLGVDPIALKLAVTSYLVSLAICIPISGWIADRLGARTTFQAALGVFMLASIGCAFSGSIGEFVFWRFVQGAGGAMMVPVGRLVLLRAVPKPELVRAFAYVTVPALIGPMMGPPVGGFLATYADWRWIFLVNLPIGLAGVVLAGLFLVNERRETPPLDIYGFLLSAVALTGLIIGAALAGRHVAPPQVAVACAMAGAIAAVLYVGHARRTARPLLDLSLFKIQTFDAGVLGGTLFRMGIGASAFLMPLMLQLGFGLDAFSSGLITFAGAVGAMTMKLVAPRLLRALGFRRVLLVNSLVASATIGVAALFTPATPHLAIIAVLYFGGFLRSLQFTSLHALSYADVDSDRLSAATSLASVAQQVSVSFGVAIGAMVLEASMWANGETAVRPHDFAVALVIVALLSSLSVLKMRKLPDHAGSEISGRVRQEEPVA